MYCVYCGAKFPEANVAPVSFGEVRFCPHCGHRIAAAEESAAGVANTAGVTNTAGVANTAGVTIEEVKPSAYESDAPVLSVQPVKAPAASEEITNTALDFLAKAAAAQPDKRDASVQVRVFAPAYSGEPTGERRPLKETSADSQQSVVPEREPANAYNERPRSSAAFALCLVVIGILAIVCGILSGVLYQVSTGALQL